MADLVLYADDDFMSPWVFHAMIALAEMRVPYRLEARHLPIEPPLRDDMRERALLAKVPCLVHGDFWLTESAAISEYLLDAFPDAPRVLPSDVRERARARQVMSWLRTSLMGLREDRPTSSVFSRPVHTALSEKGRRDADELIRITQQLLVADRQTLFSQWSVADADLALALMRLCANGDSLPQRVIDYTLAQWGRQSVRQYVANIPTAP